MQSKTTRQPQTRYATKRSAGCAVNEPNQFPPLEQVNRPTVPTEQAAHYLNRRPQTLRTWAMSSGTGPVTCIRINGRLAWSVAELRRILEVAQ